MKFYLALGELHTSVRVGDSLDTNSFLWTITEALGILGPSEIEVIDIEFRPEPDKSPLGWSLAILFCLKGYTNGHPTFRAIFTPEF